jgi:hypothetical protein
VAIDGEVHKPVHSQEAHMKGRRIPESVTGDGVRYESGDYSRIGGTWYGRTPNGLMANLANHTVAEHEDGTITVSPSILVNQGEGKSYHGWLLRGEWSDA